MSSADTQPVEVPVQPTNELFLIRAEGGPAAGTRVVDDPSWAWPLPETLDAPPGWAGRYVKVSESQLDPQPRDSRVIRGAMYEWQPAEVTTDA
jgi:hypothetical protein